MTSWIFAAFTFFVYLIQTTVLGNLTVLGIMPDAVLVCVICYGIVFGREKGFITAFVTALLMEFFSGKLFGSYIIGYLLSMTLASVLADNTFGKNFVTASVITFVVSFAGGAVMSLYYFIAKIDTNIIYTMFVGAPIYAAYNMICGVFIFIFIENLRKVSYRRE